MQVQEVIQMLQKYYKPEDQLAIAWWDLDWFKNTFAGGEHTDKQISKVFEENVDELDEALNTDWTADIMARAFQDLLDESGK